MRYAYFTEKDYVTGYKGYKVTEYLRDKDGLSKCEKKHRPIYVIILN